MARCWRSRPTTPRPGAAVAQAAPPMSPNAQSRARPGPADAVAFADKREADRTRKPCLTPASGPRTRPIQAAQTTLDNRQDRAGHRPDRGGRRSGRRSYQAQAAQTAALANAGNVPGQAPDKHPLIQAAQANLERARLNQSYTIVEFAPTDGIVTHVDQLQPGAFVNASQTVFWLITGEPWVEANFKEDQLAKMKVGQPATITIDADPAASFPAMSAASAPAPARRSRRFPPRTPPATGSRSPSACPCASNSTSRRRKWPVGPVCRPRSRSMSPDPAKQR